MLWAVVFENTINIYTKTSSSLIHNKYLKLFDRNFIQYKDLRQKISEIAYTNLHLGKYVPAPN